MTTVRRLATDNSFLEDSSLSELSLLDLPERIPEESDADVLGGFSTPGKSVRPPIAMLGIAENALENTMEGETNEASWRMEFDGATGLLNEYAPWLELEISKLNEPDTSMLRMFCLLVAMNRSRIDLTNVSAVL